MSIYPVKISEWHNKECEETSKIIYEGMIEAKKNICHDCGKPVYYGGAYMMHAVPYGYGDFRVWCELCMNKEG